MENMLVFKEHIDHTWSIVNNIREKTAEQLSYLDSNLVEKTTMVVSELLENAIKYGDSVPDASNIEFELKIENNKIIITVSNGVRNQEDIDHLVASINRINTSENAMELYIERLKEIINGDTHGRTQLGLYRIIYEGEFMLNYHVRSNIMTIIAEKSIV